MPSTRNASRRAALGLRFLGEIEVLRGAQHLALPPSKKTRALLAYLVVTGRPQRRDRLCQMFWDVADDPRAALRWSLSKLRPLVDEPARPRIVATTDTVAFDAADAIVDVSAVRTRFGDGSGVTTAQLQALAAEFRGEFLEGLELPDFIEFRMWCLAQREEARMLHARILRQLVERLWAQPEAALPYARTLVQVDPLNESALAQLVRLLGGSGRRREAEQQYEAGVRLLAELGTELSGELRRAREDMRGGSGAVEAARPNESPATAPASTAAPPPTLIGRQQEWAALQDTLGDVVQHRHLRVVLLDGEPGIGKTRLLAELAAAVRARGGTVLAGCAYEAESGRPYGPWIDALRQLPAVAIGEQIGANLAPLLPELWRASGGEPSRDRLFGATVELVAARAHSAAPVLVVLDDVQWCDEASAELLHYVARMNRHRPVLIALAARAGELPDNEPIQRVFRGLRHDQLLDDVRLGPLGPEDTAALVGALALGPDAKRVVADSAGNPLFALELARALPARRNGVPTTLSRLVRDRIERLPHDAVEVLRWAAVVGPSVRAEHLEVLASGEADQFVASLESLERHGLLRAVDGGRGPGDAYLFAHHVVREAVYAEVSTPRRRMMHARVARVLADRLGSDDAAAADLAYHAALAGEPALAARACVRAGRHCLRVFANADAEAFARRGLRHAEKVPEPERVRCMLELHEVRLGARRPPEAEESAQTIEALAERAFAQGCLEHARLGFHMVSYLRWEGGAWSDAQRTMLRAEQVSRAAGDREHAVGMAEAARCLALLERDLPQAEALLLEAGALSQRLGIEPAAIPDAVGMLRLHAGRLDDAAKLFERALVLARAAADHDDEFRALEHLVMVELQRQRYDRALARCAELGPIGDRLREGSEAPFARTLTALARYALAEPDALAELERALAALRVADAKHRLAYALTQAARVEVERGTLDLARAHAEEALRVAEQLQRPSEMALAHVVLARVATCRGDAAERARHLAALDAPTVRGVSADVRQAVDRMRTEQGRTPRVRRAR